MATERKKTPPYFMAPYEPSHAAAVQAVAEGRASEEQQRTAIRWIVEVGAMAYQPTFFPGEPDACHFAEGRRFVGNAIVKMTKLNIPAIIKAEENTNG